MKKEDIIQDLKKHRNAAKLRGDNEILKDFNICIEALEEIDNLKREVTFKTNRAEQAEMLLREVQPYCLQIDRDKISEFFKR